MNAIVGPVFRVARNAVLEGDLSKFTDMLDTGLLNLDDFNSFLVTACDKSHFKIAKICLDRGATTQERVLEKAIRNKNIEAIKFIVKEGADVNSLDGRALSNAVLWDDLDLVKFLISFGAKVDNDCNLAVYTAVSKGYLDILTVLVDSDTDGLRYTNILPMGPLVLPCMNNNLAMVSYLVDKGLDLKKYGRHALIFSAIFGHIEIVKVLVENGVDVNAPSFASGGLSSDAALRYAANNGHIEVVKYLLMNGADVHAPDDAYQKDEDTYKTQFHFEDALRSAARKEDEAMVRVLIENGADVKNCYCRELIQENYDLAGFLYRTYTGMGGHLDV